MTGERFWRLARLWRGVAAPSLAVQLFGLLVGALVVAQVVTLLLTLALPPSPPPHFELDDIAAALRQQRPVPLDRAVQAGPPDLSGGRWLISDQARTDLARRLSVAPDAVRLGFFTQLPLTGLMEPPEAERPHLPLDARPIAAPARSRPLNRLRDGGGRVSPIVGLLAAVPVEGQSGPPPGGGGGGGFPGGGPGGPGQGGPGGFPGRAWPSDRSGSRREGDRTRSGADRAAGDRGASGRPWGGFGPAGDASGRRPAGIESPASSSREGEALGQREPSIPGPGVAGPPWAGGGEGARGRIGAMRSGGLDRAFPIVPPNPPVTIVPPVASPATLSMPIRTPRADASRDIAIPERSTTEVVRSATPATVPTPSALPGARLPTTTRVADAAVVPRAASHPLPVTRVAPGLFGLAPAPFVEGDFVAAVRLADGRWAVVTPRSPGFLDTWRGRVLVWFVLSLLIVAPLAWAFARRLVGPLKEFAAAAEMLGRDPSAAILPLDGPAEIGRAAHAFNQMQSRLHSFVDDRTAMIGAISHDLRTPLTRLRFRIEDLDDAEREGFLGEVVEMEEMISSVIAFMRDASLPHRRERLDLAELLDVAVEDAALVGGSVSTGPVQPAPVDVDALGIRRVLDNLLTNAVKYGGGGARVALRVEENQAVADIIDTGPGIPDDEISRVFEPFYRSLAARQSDREGSGLGLAVCRSIARAHGGDVNLFRSHEGFVARVTLPLAYDAEMALAA